MKACGSASRVEDRTEHVPILLMWRPEDLPFQFDLFSEKKNIHWSLLVSNIHISSPEYSKLACMLMLMVRSQLYGQVADWKENRIPLKFKVRACSSLSATF